MSTTLPPGPPAPTDREDPELLLLAAVSQRQQQNTLALVQRLVHRRGLAALGRFQQGTLSRLEDGGARPWLEALLQAQARLHGPLPAATAGEAPIEAAGASGPYAQVETVPGPSGLSGLEPFAAMPAVPPFTALPEGSGRDAELDARRATAAVDAAIAAMVAEFPDLATAPLPLPAPPALEESSSLPVGGGKSTWPVQGGRMYREALGEPDVPAAPVAPAAQEAAETSEAQETSEASEAQETSEASEAAQASGSEKAPQEQGALGSQAVQQPLAAQDAPQATDTWAFSLDPFEAGAFAAADSRSEVPRVPPHLVAAPPAAAPLSGDRLPAEPLARAAATAGEPEESGGSWRLWAQQTRLSAAGLGLRLRHRLMRHRLMRLRPQEARALEPWSSESPPPVQDSLPLDPPPLAASEALRLPVLDSAGAPESGPRPEPFPGRVRLAPAAPLSGAGGPAPAPAALADLRVWLADPAQRRAG